MKLEKSKFDFFYKRSKQLDKYSFELAKSFVDLLFYNENINTIKELLRIELAQNDIKVEVRSKNKIDFPDIGFEQITGFTIIQDEYDDIKYCDINIETTEDDYTLFRLYYDHVEFIHFNLIDAMQIVNNLKQESTFKLLLDKL